MRFLTSILVLCVAAAALASIPVDARAPHHKLHVSVSVDLDGHHEQSQGEAHGLHAASAFAAEGPAHERDVDAVHEREFKRTHDGFTEEEWAHMSNEAKDLAREEGRGFQIHTGRGGISTGEEPAGVREIPQDQNEINGGHFKGAAQPLSPEEVEIARVGKLAAKEAQAFHEDEITVARSEAELIAREKEISKMNPFKAKGARTIDHLKAENVRLSEETRVLQDRRDQLQNKINKNSPDRITNEQNYAEILADVHFISLREHFTKTVEVDGERQLEENAEKKAEMASELPGLDQAMAEQKALHGQWEELKTLVDPVKFPVLTIETVWNGREWAPSSQFWILPSEEGPAGRADHDGKAITRTFRFANEGEKKGAFAALAKRIQGAENRIQARRLPTMDTRLTILRKEHQNNVDRIVVTEQMKEPREQIF